MDLAKEIVLRYRSSGHVRFALPDALCSPAIAGRLVADLRRIEGIYRVDLSRRQRKLSVRFIEHICDFAALSHALYQLVAAVDWTAPQSESPTPVPAVPARMRKRLLALAPVRWIRGKWQEARETVTAMRVLARREAVRQRARSLLSENTVIFILNDALAIYLVRLHWPLITQQWVRRPWLHRYEWMAAGYLMYLFARSRRNGE